MKKFAVLILAVINLSGAIIYAQDHTQHPKHNMILFGDKETLYASHIVYKVPHNYQVILKLNLSVIVKEKVAIEMQSHPSEQFIYLLNHIDIGQIQSKPEISGQIFRRADGGSKQIIFEQVGLKDNEYSIIYFDELPLSLSSKNLIGTK